MRAAGATLPLSNDTHARVKWTPTHSQVPRRVACSPGRRDPGPTIEREEVKRRTARTPPVSSCEASAEPYWAGGDKRLPRRIPVPRWPPGAASRRRMRGREFMPRRLAERRRPRPPRRQRSRCVLHTRRVTHPSSSIQSTSSMMRTTRPITSHPMRSLLPGTTPPRLAPQNGCHHRPMPNWPRGSKLAYEQVKGVALIMGEQRVQLGVALHELPCHITAEQ